MIPTEEESYLIEKGDLRTRFRYVKRCKDNVLNRWTQEYLKGLRERHIMKNGKKTELKIGDVVLIKSDEKNRGKWKIGVVTDTFPGSDNVVRAVELRTANGFLERPVQFLYPLELTCDIQKGQKDHETVLDAKAQEFEPRDRRAASEAAKLRIKGQLGSVDNI